MAQEAVALLATACCDVLGGICLDFISIRHSCTETLCRCNCCGYRNIRLEDDEEDEAGVSETHQPESHAPMQTHPPNTTNG
ncbi:hypothetical protein BDQ17DRAFT_1353662 [Cyathus striatus]|nr:hypothetical protein BDQ17DRAFT_1353662 [Cyathus striatus]